MGEETVFIYVEEDDAPLLQPNLETFKNPQIQYFDFPDTIIHYLLKECSFKVYEKLIKSCKYFFSKKRVTIFPDIAVGYFSEDKKNCQKNLIYHKNYSENRRYDAVSKFCPKIYKCHAIHVVIRNQRMTQKEFDLLVHPKYVITFHIEETSVLNTTENSFLAVEDVVKRVPNALWLWLLDLPCTANTFSILAKLKRNTKIKLFQYHSLSPYKYFDIDMFQKLVTEHASSKAIFGIQLGDIDTSLFEAYKKRMVDFVNSWNPIAEQPEIYLSQNTEYVILQRASQAQWESSFISTHV